MNGKTQHEKEPELKTDQTLLSEDMAKTLLKIRNDENHAMGIMGIKATEVGLGWAVGEMVIKEQHLNPMGGVHGGLIFSLADSVGGTAAWTRGNLVVTTNASFNFLNAAIHTRRLIARATELKAGKNVLTYEVEVRSEEELLLAKGIFEYHSFKIPFTEYKNLYKNH